MHIPKYKQHQRVLFGEQVVSITQIVIKEGQPYYRISIHDGREIVVSEKDITAQERN